MRFQLGKLSFAIGRDLRENDSPMPESVSTQDQSYAFPSLITGYDWPTYNPDDLIGRQGAYVYDRMMTDEQVKAVVHFRRDSVTGRSWHFEAPAGLDPEEGEKRVAMFKDIVKSYPGQFKSDLDKIFASLYQGVSITEWTLKQFVGADNKTWVGIRHLRKKPYHTFYFYTDDFGNLVRFTQRVDGREKDLDPRKFIIHVHNTDTDEYYGRSELREAYRAWYSKDVTIKLMNIYMERLAGGLKVLKAVGEKRIIEGSNEYNQLINAVARAQSSSSLLLPNGVDMQLHFPPGDAGKTYEMAIAMHDKSIAKSLLVPNLLGLSEQGQVGSFSQSQTQLKAFLWMSDAEAVDLQETLNEQLFRRLGEANFDDGLYPKFCFDPLSDDQILEVMKTWNQLVNGNVVVNTPEDEDAIRSKMEMPPRALDEDEDKEEKPQLNGAQLQSLQDLMEKLAARAITPEGAIIVLVEGLGVSKERAEEMINQVVQALPEPEPTPTPEGEDDEGEGDEPEDDEGEDDEPEDDEPEDETILGRNGVRVHKSAFIAAEKRVDFKRIDSETTAIIVNGVAEMSPIALRAIESVVSQVEEMDLSSPEVSQVRIGVDSKASVSMRKRFASVLNKAWILGQKEGRKELARALGDGFSAKDLGDLQRFARIEEEAAQRYLSTRAFAMTGGFNDAITGIVRNQILNGIRYAWSTRQVIDKVYEQLISNGMLEEAAAQEITSRRGLEQALAKLTDVSAPNHRLETMVRTATFESLNEARNTFFTDPDLSEIIVAYQYSSILDDQTTTICNELDNHKHGINWTGWQVYRPPNHYNCRSLLIPILNTEEWSDSGPPTVDPQEGFG